MSKNHQYQEKSFQKTLADSMNLTKEDQEAFTCHFTLIHEKNTKIAELEKALEKATAHVRAVEGDSGMSLLQLYEKYLVANSQVKSLLKKNEALES